MITQHQYLIFEAEFISSIKRITKFLISKGYLITHESSLGENNCLINIFSMYHYLYNNEKIKVNSFFNDNYNLGEVFSESKHQKYEPTPILKCEIIGDSELTISIDFTVYVKPNLQTHSFSLVLDRDFDKSQILDFKFSEWKLMMQTFVNHILDKIK